MRELATDREIAAIKPDGSRRVFRVGGTRGLRLDVRRGGTMSWIVWYRTKAGKPRTHTLGRYPEMSLAQARAETRRIVARVDLEHDPLAERLETRAKAAEEKRRVDRRPLTRIDALTERFLASLPLKPKTLKEWQRLAQVEIIPALGELQAESLTRPEIRAWSAQIKEGDRPWRRDLGPATYTANRAFEVLRRVYSWAVEQDLLTSSPFFRMPKPSVEEQSERVLTADEIRAVWLAVREIGGPYADAVELLFLTGVRRDMVVGMRRSELEDLGGPDARWIIPGGFEGRTKSHAVHVVPLSAQAEGLIRRRMDLVPGEPLFPPTRTSSAEAMTWSSRFVETMRRKANEHAGRKLPRWTVHNIRHTVGTHLREDLKVSRDIVSLILGHTPAGAVASRIYDRAQMLPERRDALTIWANWIDGLAVSTATPKGAKVPRPVGRPAR